MESNANIINWFDIPVNDMERAKKFYEEVFSIQMNQMDMNGMLMAFFPMENMSGKVSGALVKHETCKPSNEGTRVYINGNPDLTNALNKVDGAGGKILMPKTKIDENSGYMAFFADTEGNMVGMHSMK